MDQIAIIEIEEEIQPRLEINDEVLIDLDLDEDTEVEETKKKSEKRERERRRLILVNTLFSMVEEVEDIESSSRNKTVLVLLPNASISREFLTTLKKNKPETPRTAYSVGNIYVAFNEFQLKNIVPNFIAIYLDETIIKTNLLNKAGKDFNFTNKETEEISNALIKKDANRELCRKCKEEDPDCLPYGNETGEIEWKPQFDNDNKPIVDDEGNQLYVEFPELTCAKGHRWYKGEGARRNVKGRNPVLLDSHYKMRQQREIHVDIGTPDPAFTRDRFGRPTRGEFNTTHPNGRKVNTPEQRRRSGASFYR